MSDDNVVNIKAHDITPQKVVDELGKDKEIFDEIYVCAVSRDGKRMAYMSGNMAGLGLAAICFQDLAIRYLNGEIE